MELRCPIQNLRVLWLLVSKKFSEAFLSLYLFPLCVSLKKMKWKLSLFILLGQIKLGYTQISVFPNLLNTSCEGYYYAPQNNINPATNYSSNPLTGSVLFAHWNHPRASKTVHAWIPERFWLPERQPGTGVFKSFPGIFEYTTLWSGIFWSGVRCATIVLWEPPPPQIILLHSLH